MSTRGVVAVKINNGWVGVYNHYDSYPSVLLKNVINEILKWKKEGKTLKEFCEELLKYDDWRNFLNKGRCEYCGKVGYGQACDISGIIYDKITNKKIKNNIKKYGVPDPFCEYHGHNDINNKMTPLNTNPIWCEWLYIIDPKNETIEVYTNKEKLTSYCDLYFSCIKVISLKDPVIIDRELQEIL